MRTSELTEKQVIFLEKYEQNYNYLNLLMSIGRNITEEGKDQKSRLQKYLTDNLPEYMNLTN